MVELSDIFKQEEETKLDYVKRHMSSELAEFIGKQRIQSCNQLVREILTLNVVKVEFIFKRRKAKKMLLQKINHLRALLKDGAEHLSDMFASKRWLRFKKDGNARRISFNHNDVVYVAELVNYSGEEPSIKCYQGRVSGAKIAKEKVAFYYVHFENSIIDKVHEDSLLTKHEFEQLATDVALMMNMEKKGKEMQN